MNDREFYQRRLREELARSVTESDSKLRALHSEWAGHYQERLNHLPGTDFGTAA